MSICINRHVALPLTRTLVVLAGKQAKQPLTVLSTSKAAAYFRFWGSYCHVWLSVVVAVTRNRKHFLRARGSQKPSKICRNFDGDDENAGRENDGREIDGPMCRA